MKKAITTMLGALMACSVLLLAVSCDSLGNVSLGGVAAVDSNKHFTQDLKFLNGADYTTYGKDGTFEQYYASWDSTSKTFKQSSGYKGTYTYDPATFTLVLTNTKYWSNNSSAYVDYTNKLIETDLKVITERGYTNAYTYNPALGTYTYKYSTVMGSVTYDETTTYTFLAGAFKYDKTTKNFAATTTTTVDTKAGTYKAYGTTEPALRGSAITYSYVDTLSTSTVNGGLPTTNSLSKGTESFSIINESYASGAASSFGRKL